MDVSVTTDSAHLTVSQAIKEEVKYDLQILADHIEFYWTHLTGIGTLENSLWGWDGEQIRVWLNALTIDTPASAAQEELEGPQRERERTSTGGALESVEESLAISIDFYPLCQCSFPECACLC